ncbi:MAG: glycoside hydrolase family 3 protein [Bacteroidota bacterium]|nr:glycoside hydrolase family 3 protein [Bacteroidota bacterium]
MKAQDNHSLIGQLFMPRLEVSKYEEDLEYRRSIEDLIGEGMVGGFCVFGGTVESLPIILGELQALAEKSSLPKLLMAADCEWGLPMRLDRGGTEFPHLMALERMGDQDGIRKVAAAIGREMSALGLHWNFAPVADVNSNPDNPIINIRAFSGDPEVVSRCAQSFFEGLESVGIISTAKHFPGHGDTNIDSHLALPLIAKSQDEFDQTELLPFKELISRGIPSIMTGHIAAPKLAKSLGASEGEMTLPATISPYLTERLLRKELHFDGVIITDSLEMHGLRTLVEDPGEIAVRAFLAGADLLLMPTDPIAAHKGLLKAVDEKRIPLDWVSQSVARVNNLRLKYLNDRPLHAKVEWLIHEQLADKAGIESLESLGEVPKPLLLSSVIIFAAGTESEKEKRDMLQGFFFSELPDLSVNIFIGGLPERIYPVGTSPLIVTLHRPRGALTADRTSGSIDASIQKIVDMFIQKRIQPAGIIAIGDPYSADRFLDLNPGFVIKTYSDSKPSINALLQKLESKIRTI